MVNLVANMICWFSGLGLMAAAITVARTGSSLTKFCGLFVLLTGAFICAWVFTANTRQKLRLSVAVVSSCLMLVVSESALRLLTNYPISRSSNVIAHAELGYMLDPAMPDVDSNRFRNAVVPETVDIVAIGDSHTQGFNVPSSESWPAQLGAQLNLSTYNMGIGGYGPRHYDILIDRALALDPRQIILGLYIGNDLWDVTQEIAPRPEVIAAQDSFRDVLKYRIAIGSLVNQTLKRSPAGRPPGFDVPHAKNPTYTAESRIAQYEKTLDSTKAETAAAISDTLQILVSANERCQDQGVRLIVAVIPTRESVYYENMKADSTEVAGVLARVAKPEGSTRKQLLSKLQTSGIIAVDLLPALAAALNTRTHVYPHYDDGHPLANGYAVYASTIAQAVTSSGAPGVLTN